MKETMTCPYCKRQFEVQIGLKDQWKTEKPKMEGRYLVKFAYRDPSGNYRVNYMVDRFNQDTDNWCYDYNFCKFIGWQEIPGESYHDFKAMRAERDS
jgi:hypothetical protein